MSTRAERLAKKPAITLIYPSEASGAVLEVLGLMSFQTGPIAHAMQDCGADIPKAIEAEQAHVLHTLLLLALEHGDQWKPHAADLIQELQEKRNALAGKAR